MIKNVNYWEQQLFPVDEREQNYCKKTPKNGIHTISKWIRFYPTATDCGIGLVVQVIFKNIHTPTNIRFEQQKEMVCFYEYPSSEIQGKPIHPANAALLNAILDGNISGAYLGSAIITIFNLEIIARAKAKEPKAVIIMDCFPEYMEAMKVFDKVETSE